MKKIATGDNKACRQFVDTHMPMIYRVCVRTLGSDRLAEDVSQDVFMKVWRFADTFDGKSKLKTWIYRITINTCLDTFKKQKIHTNIDDFEIADNTDLADVDYLKKKTAEQIQDGLCLLKPKERTAIVLFYWEERRIKDIAKILEIGEKATESLLRRTRSKLAYILKGEI